MTGRELIKKLIEIEDFDLEDDVEVSLIDTRDTHDHTEIVNFDIQVAEQGTLFIHAQKGRIHGSNKNIIINCPEEK
tara:strand:+ start:397 stop:624 length:228 start_codon:yes stop_codon:yes gene_type:complete